MKLFIILSAVLCFVLFAVILTSYICFAKVFLADRRGEKSDVPHGDIFEPYQNVMRSYRKEVENLPFEECVTRSFDGLSLYGRYYECRKGAPIELMFHGYRGDAMRDLSGGVLRCFALERNVLIIDHRSAGKSEGKIITFGINEHRDCLSWIDFAVKRFGAHTKLILTGISMGAATVLTAAGCELPENVYYVLADCPYTSGKEIIKKEISGMKLPPDILYPFVKLGGRLFGGFDIDGFSPLDAIGKTTVPIIFFHGAEDSFVPCEMSRRLYTKCTSKKKFVEVKGADHGLAYPVDPDGYLGAIREFEEYIKTTPSRLSMT